MRPLADHTTENFSFPTISDAAAAFSYLNRLFLAHTSDDAAAPTYDVIMSCLFWSVPVGRKIEGE